MLPAAIPNLLVNGTAGIAVGMATNMAPHNLGEVVAAARHLIAHPDASLDELMRFVPGPDLPTGGKIVGLDGIREAYETGRGMFRTRAAARIEKVTPRRTGIVVTELPYGIGPEKVSHGSRTWSRPRSWPGIADLKDLTDRHRGLQLVIEVRSGFHPEAVLEELYRLTPMEDTFGINNVALVDGQPRLLGLRELLQIYVDHRIEVVRRRTAFRRRKREDRMHLVDGLLIALLNIDEVIQVIRTSDDAAAAKERLMAVFDLIGDPGPVHPGHPAAPADPLRPAGAGARARDPGARDRRAHRDPGLRGAAPRDGLGRARRRQQEVRDPAPHGAAGEQRRGQDGRGAAGGGRRSVHGAAVLGGAAGPDGRRRRRPRSAAQRLRRPRARRPRRRGAARRARRDRLGGAVHGARHGRAW